MLLACWADAAAANCGGSAVAEALQRIADARQDGARTVVDCAIFFFVFASIKDENRQQKWQLQEEEEETTVQGKKGNCSQSPSLQVPRAHIQL